MSKLTSSDDRSTGRCPDGGFCHHNCPGEPFSDFGDPIEGQPCFRVLSAGPLSGTYPDNRWPESVVRRHRLMDGQCPSHGSTCAPVSPAIEDPAEVEDTVPVVAAPDTPDFNRARLFNAIHIHRPGGPDVFRHDTEQGVIVSADLNTATSPTHLDINVQRLGPDREVLLLLDVHQPELVRFHAGEARWRGFAQIDALWTPVVVSLSRQ